MKKTHFKQHVRGATPNLPWQKRHDFKYERKKTIIKIEDMPRIKHHSFLTGEDSTPHWEINIMARRMTGSDYPQISSTQSISGSQFGEAIACMILDLHKKLQYDPVSMACAITKVVAEAYKDYQNRVKKEADNVVG